MSGLDILALAGPATVQDRGRPGWQRFGVSAGGALDPYALAEGQALLGNGADAAALEMPGAGGRFRVGRRLVIATSGAEMALRVDGVARPWRSTIAVEAGEVLEIGAATGNAVGYLHLPGGIDAPVELGARSGHPRAGIGMRPAAGDCLRPLGSGGTEGRMLARPAYLDRRRIRVMWGPQSGLFDAATRDRFLGDGFRASLRRDRQGMRIDPDGGPFDSSAGLTTVSEAVVLGDVQIPGDGIPAVLFADRQPTGGYPRIATVIGADLPSLVQMPPGARFTLDLVTRSAALAARSLFLTEMAALPEQLYPGGAALLHRMNLISGAIRGDEHDGEETDAD